MEGGHITRCFSVWLNDVVSQHGNVAMTSKRRSGNEMRCIGSIGQSALYFAMLVIAATCWSCHSDGQLLTYRPSFSMRSVRATSTADASRESVIDFTILDGVTGRACTRVLLRFQRIGVDTSYEQWCSGPRIHVPMSAGKWNVIVYSPDTFSSAYVDSVVIDPDSHYELSVVTGLDFVATP